MEKVVRAHGELERRIKEEYTAERCVLELTDEIPELVYVADLDTYELLFVNRTGKTAIGTNDAEGQKCYKLLQGLDSPCSFCTNNKLTPDNVYTWEHSNRLTGAHYLLHDKLVKWNGKYARMEIAFDLTAQNNERYALQQTIEAEKELMECVRLLYSAEDLNVACTEVLEKMVSFWKGDRGYIFEIQNGRMYNTLECCAEGVAPMRDTLQDLDISLIDRWRPVFDRQECVVIEDIEDIKNSSPEEYAALALQNIHSLVVAPLEIGGELVGYVGLDNPHKGDIAKAIPLFHTLRYFVMTAMRRAQSEEHLMRLSYYDELTGMYNRNRFVQDMQDAQTVEKVGIVHVNVNGMKTVNENYGHVEGDRILAECARRMQHILKGASFYRTGGDEFVAVWRAVAREEFDQSVMELKESLAMDGGQPSAVGARWQSSCGNLQLLFSAASELMYNDKKHYYRMTLSRGRYRHYNDDVLGLTNPETLERELAAKSFVVYYQPKFRFEDSGHAGAEALVRYRMSNGTLVAPQQFIPLLEDARLITKLDFYMLEQVCADIARWHKAGVVANPVAVNFSRYSLIDKQLVPHMEAICAQYGIDKSCIEIEVTESVEGVDGFDVKKCLESMRETGFTVSIDDFGARYANMYLFASTRFDVLKLDKSLIDDVTLNENVLMMLEVLGSYCKKLGIETVAEGVETQEQFDLLRGIGITLVQGYLFSKPLSPSEYERKYLLME